MSTTLDAEKEGGPPAESDPTVESLDRKIWEKSRRRLHFQNENMDYYLSWVLAYQGYTGAQHGECFYVASTIQDGDPESWTQAWIDMARRVEGCALEALEQGHFVTARESYLRAFTYYRAASFCMRPEEWRFYDTWEDMRSCFRMAAALFDPPVQHVDIPYEGTVLPGYFIRPDDSAEKRPTLIMIGSGETFAEELYFWAGAPGVERGYNVLSVDLPGQGGNPFGGLFYRVDSEVPVKAVVDYALSRPEVDPEKLAIYGISGGGYMVARAVAFDKRMKACIVNPPVTNMHKLMIEELPGILRKVPADIGDTILKLGGHENPLTSIVLEKECWQSGVSRISEALEKAKAARLDGLVYEITCPTLCLVSEGESEEQAIQATAVYDALTCPKQLRIFTAEEGAEAHCQVNNFSLMQEVVFDWLDDLFS